MNKEQKLAVLSEALGTTLPEELTVAQIDSILKVVGEKKDQAVELEQAHNAYDALKSAFDEMVKTNEDLAAALKAAEEKGVVISDKPVVKIGNNSYKVLGGARIKDKVYTAAEIAADKDLAKSLIDRGSGILQKI